MKANYYIYTIKDYYKIYKSRIKTIYFLSAISTPRKTLRINSLETALIGCSLKFYKGRKSLSIKEKAIRKNRSIREEVD